MVNQHTPQPDMTPVDKDPADPHLTEPIKQHLTGDHSNDTMSKTQPRDGMESSSDASEGKTKPYMLLVEDNAINMKVLERLCQRLSLPYQLAFNGLEAVKLFEAEPGTFDIIWMDIMMPIMDGLAATKQIRNIERSSGRCEIKDKVRVIALTGLSGEDIENDTTDVGFDAFWTKPVKLDILRKEIDRWTLPREQQIYSS